MFRTQRRQRIATAKHLKDLFVSIIMRRKLYIMLIFAILASVFVLNSKLDLYSNSTSPRLENSTVYGTGCPENPFHERLERLFRTWKSMAARRNILYFVCYGGLLGLYRDGDVIPYDNDLDICIFRKDLPKLAKEDEPKPFKVDDGKPHLIYQKNCHHPSPDTPRKTCRGVETTEHVDQCTFLDPCARLVLRPPISARTTWIDVFALRDNGTYLIDDWKTVTHKRAVILPLKPCVLMGMRTECPNDITGYLTRYYGTDFATNSHHICKNGEWVATGRNVKIIAVPRCLLTDILCHVSHLIHNIRKIFQY